MEFRRRVRAAFLSGSNDGCQVYRTACLKALGQVCKAGDEEVLLCLGAKLSDASDDARKEACNALARLGADKRLLVPGQVDWSKRGNVRKQFELESALWARIQDAARRRSARPSVRMSLPERAETERASVDVRLTGDQVPRMGSLLR